ncbi:hypothetical protein NA56DRAFT_661438 [Hyaloscypha hepaticicola]|uniref:Uncharacterized protein n=1 Tax=Hyaloscypha hepaticicola TaxID=2082293 RepID=A0A2J6PVT7_9HELO|nr:hypothetical protein NA56DRAFT_661438 [Hyaloscypha hepaticicola]
MSSTTATTAAPAAAPAGPPLPPPPPALPALPAQPTRTMAALALLPPRRRAVLRAGRTTNPARPSNLEAELGQIVGQARIFRYIHCTRGQAVKVLAARSALLRGKFFRRANLIGPGVTRSDQEYESGKAQNLEEHHCGASEAKWSHVWWIEY